MSTGRQYPVADDDSIAPLLAKWFADHGIAAQVEVSGRATVGLSQQTWFVRVVIDGSATPAVLRCPTPASGARAIRTQIAALRAVAETPVPAPRLLWCDEDDDNALNQPFLVMSRVEGEVPIGWHELPQLARNALASNAIDIVAALHAIDPRPIRTALPTAVDVAWYRRQLSKLAPVPTVVTAALWWLERHQPAPVPTAFVHGDFRMGNFVIDGTRVAAVLDWEMAGRGDPIADLAWCFIPVWELARVDEADLVQRYSQRSHRPVDPQRLQWHRVLGFLRLAYYALSGAKAFDAGRSHDLRLAALRLQLPVHLDRLAATMTGEAIW
jgi:aminoglycoside phosphotransferase (APT) family kinase protein